MPLPQTRICFAEDINDTTWPISFDPALYQNFDSDLTSIMSKVPYEPLPTEGEASQAPPPAYEEAPTMKPGSAAAVPAAMDLEGGRGGDEQYVAGDEEQDWDIGLFGCMPNHKADFCLACWGAPLLSSEFLHEADGSSTLKCLAQPMAFCPAAYSTSPRQECVSSFIMIVWRKVHADIANKSSPSYSRDCCQCPERRSFCCQRCWRSG